MIHVKCLLEFQEKDSIPKYLKNLWGGEILNWLIGRWPHYLLKIWAQRKIMLQKQVHSSWKTDKERTLMHK